MDQTDAANEHDSDGGAEFLDWIVNIVEGGTIVSKLTSEIESLPKGTEFSVAGTVEDDGYVYVIQVNGRDLAVLYPADRGQADAEKASTKMHLPADGQRFVAPLDGAVFVVEADHVMTSDDWKALFPVRDPPLATNHGPALVAKDPKVQLRAIPDPRQTTKPDPQPTTKPEQR